MKPKQAPIRIYVRALVRGHAQHGFVWRLQRGEVEVLRDIAPTRPLAELLAESSRNGIVLREHAASIGVIEV
jgi:hypothetical protein